jgi:hypothetical protein
VTLSFDAVGMTAASPLMLAVFQVKVISIMPTPHSVYIMCE